MLNKLATLAIVSVVLFSGCKKDEDDIILPVTSSVVVTSPVNSATGVERNKVITVTFSLPMDPLSINNSSFTLMDGVASVAGIVAYFDTTATFSPSNLLDANTNYTASLSTEVKSADDVPLANDKVWSFTTAGVAGGQAPVDLGSSINYVILAKSAVNNSPTSAITGNMGLSPAATSYITGMSLTDATGYATSAQLTGKIYAADMADPTPMNLTTSVNNMITAYNDAAGRPSPDFSELTTGNIGGRTLTPGLYKWTNTVTIPADVTISGGADDVWIFQIAGNLTQSSAVKMILSGGAKASNIFWQVAGEVTVGTTAHFEGIILCQTGITLQTGASMNGRALAQTAVIIDGNTMVNP